MSQQATLDAFKADFEAGNPPYNVPPEVIQTMHRATAELIAGGAATLDRRPFVQPEVGKKTDCAIHVRPCERHVGNIPGTHDRRFRP